MRPVPTLTLRGELSLRKDRHWVTGYFSLVLCLPAVMVAVTVPSLLGKGVVIALALSLALVGYVRVQCARQLERILGESTPIRVEALHEDDAEGPA